MLSLLQFRLQPMHVALAVLVLALSFVAVAPSISADPVTHRVAIHVDDNDPQRMNMALNNVRNIKKYYDSVDEKVEIEVVAYGPGLHMLRADTSPVIDRIEAMSLEIEGLKFSACGDTHAAMGKHSGNEVELLEQATMVPSGIAQLIHLQEKGYAYVRP